MSAYDTVCDVEEPGGDCLAAVSAASVGARDEEARSVAKTITFLLEA